ncbi:MAG: hypothetical protein WC655_29865, partial [Candidatus Hydrogenedentales bacterium]
MSHWYTTHWYESESGSASTPTLTWADTGDGTGGTATVAGSYAASTNTIYYASYAGDSETMTWTSAGSRTGDGTVAVSLASGHYLLRCHSAVGSDASDSSILYITVSNSTEVVEYRLATAIQARIQALTL